MMPNLKRCNSMEAFNLVASSLAPIGLPCLKPCTWKSICKCSRKWANGTKDSYQFLLTTLIESPRPFSGKDKELNVAIRHGLLFEYLHTRVLIKNLSRWTIREALAFARTSSRIPEMEPTRPVRVFLEAFLLFIEIGTFASTPWLNKLLPAIAILKNIDCF